MIVLKWLKANWKWILFPIGLAMWFLNRRTEMVVVPSALDEHDKVKAKIDKDSADAINKAKARRDLELEVERKRQEDATAKADTEYKELVDKLVDDPNATTGFLTSVGKNVRGE